MLVKPFLYLSAATGVVWIAGNVDLQLTPPTSRSTPTLSRFETSGITVGISNTTPVEAAPEGQDADQRLSKHLVMSSRSIVPITPYTEIRYDV